MFILFQAMDLPGRRSPRNGGMGLWQVITQLEDLRGVAVADMMPQNSETLDWKRFDEAVAKTRTELATRRIKDRYSKNWVKLMSEKLSVAQVFGVSQELLDALTVMLESIQKEAQKLPSKKITRF